MSDNAADARLPEDKMAEYFNLVNLTETIMPIVIIAINALRDLKSREIYVIPTVICMAAGIVYQVVYCGIQPPELIFMLSPGLMILGISFLTGGAIGRGDSILILAIGALTGGENTWLMLAIAMAMTAVCAAVLWIKKSGVKELPFAPFMLPAMIVVILIGGF